jgi:hypothetical protein
MVGLPETALTVQTAIKGSSIEGLQVKDVCQLIYKSVVLTMKKEYLGGGEI